MVRIGGGVFPDIKEKDYLGEGGYRVDDKAGKVLWVLNHNRCSETTILSASLQPNRQLRLAGILLALDCSSMPSGWQT